MIFLQGSIYIFKYLKYILSQKNVLLINNFENLKKHFILYVNWFSSCFLSRRQFFSLVYIFCRYIQ